MEEGAEGRSRTSCSSEDKESDAKESSLPADSNLKKRKSRGPLEKTDSASGRTDKRPQSESSKAAPRILKKIREEVQDLHAETQRILRETPGTSFAPERGLRKPVLSLIEKIRQRKFQLSNSLAKKPWSTLGGSLEVSGLDHKDDMNERAVDGDIELVISKPLIRLLVEQEPRTPSTPAVPRDEPTKIPATADNLDDTGDGFSSQLSTPDIQFDRSNSNSGHKSSPRSFGCGSLLGSQDLYSDSQLSFKDDSPVLGDEEGVIPARSSLRNLQNEGDDRWTDDGDVEKENRDPSVISSPEHIPLVAGVRCLIDDEAEDEDEEDDSVEDEDDEGQETAGELQDLLSQDVSEKPADAKRRAELHSKWLEQQDLAIEDSILHRIESGWKSKAKKVMPTLLNGSQDRASEVDDVARSFKGVKKLREPASGESRGSSFEFHTKEVKVDDHLCEGKTGSANTDQDVGDLVQQEEYPESSDDEEAEETLRRQLFLQESEEKTVFLSVTDDESSREIFARINKVNVTTTKSRSTTAHASGTGYHQPLGALQHQSSFLRRKVTTASVTTKQGSGSSRSYVFGRDDSNSNSRDANRLDSKEQIGSAKLSGESKGQSTTESTQNGASSRPKNPLIIDTKRRGPSLIQVLKQQAAELARGKNPLDLSASSSRGDNLSIFMPIRPSRQPKGSRGR